MSSLNKPEYPIISRMVQSGSSVLDLGCGDGELLALLNKEKNTTKSQGIEIDEQAIYKCVARGVSVFHGDIDSGLTEYPDNSFDYVILNQSLQQVKKPDVVLTEALRVGHKVIVGFPNFANISSRYQLALKGRAPVTPSLPFQWYDSPNLHFLSLADFKNYCHSRKIIIREACYLGENGPVRLFPNIFASLGVFLISRQ